jgi:hypothetical protein
MTPSWIRPNRPRSLFHGSRIRIWFEQKKWKRADLFLNPVTDLCEPFAIEQTQTRIPKASNFQNYRPCYKNQVIWLGQLHDDEWRLLDVMWWSGRFEHQSNQSFSELWNIHSIGDGGCSAWTVSCGPRKMYEGVKATIIRNKRCPDVILYTVGHTPDAVHNTPYTHFTVTYSLVWALWRRYR